MNRLPPSVTTDNDSRLELHPLALRSHTWLRDTTLGSASWWQRLQQHGAPLVELISPQQACVSFIWRDLYGQSQHSPFERVYIDINAVTDHHSFSPQSLHRIAGTDVWFWQTVLPSDWRGSYSLIPATAEQRPPPPERDPLLRRQQQRRWWMELFSAAQIDSLNPQRCYGVLSALHLPDAPAQTAWKALNPLQPPAVHHLQWNSAALKVTRSIWLYQCGPADPQQPLVLLLDGQVWAQRLPVYDALHYATEQQQLPPALYVLIDAVDAQQRDCDLACNAQFWQALHAELLPQIHALSPHSQQPQRRVLAGQSFGGLAAMYAALHWPQWFGCVLTQSGSFWWPYVELLNQATATAGLTRQGWLTEQLAQQHLSSTAPLRIFQEVGSREDVMVTLNRGLAEQLRQAGHTLHYREFNGGHDYLCWRGGLIDGLAWLLGEDRHAHA